MIRIVIADQTKFVCDFMRVVLSQQEDIYVIGGTSEVEQLHFLIPQCDVALVGYNFAGGKTASLIQELSSKYEDVRLIIVGVPEEFLQIMQFVESGVMGYILENEDAEDLVCKIRATVNGRALVSDEVAALMMQHINYLANTPSASLNHKKKEQIALLTTRQREVLMLICEGLTNQEIGAYLHIQCGTVKNHVHHILKKIGVPNRHEAAFVYRMYDRDNGAAAPNNHHLPAAQLALSSKNSSGRKKFIPLAERPYVIDSRNGTGRRLQGQQRYENSN